MEDWQMIKKIWKNEEAVSPVIAVILMVAITVVLAAVLYVWAQSFAGDTGGITTIAWSVSVEGDNYIIEIIDVQSESLDEVSWSILNLNRLVTSWEDPFGDTLRMEGDMLDVNFSQAGYNSADATDSGKFYAQDPIGDPPVNMNHTLCIVYMDTNSDGKLTSGDVIWIRSTDNDGSADEDFRFRMVNEKVGKAYGERVLPAT